MPGERDRYEEKAEERENTEYMVRYFHGVKG
jgi:hypothetical protein